MNTFLFDLDGTLLPMNQDEFIDGYFKALAGKLIPYGIDADIFIKAVLKGTKAMIDNDGSMYNNERFWTTFTGILGEGIRELEDVFLDYYQNEFQEMKQVTTANPLAKATIGILKDKGYRIILATNPLFPPIATHSRIHWAGLSPEDFELITTYDNSSFCKPNIEYFKEILKSRELDADQCIMVGNDISDDMIAIELGLDAYLVTDCIINPRNENIDRYTNGSFDDFYNYVKELPYINE